jgi:hypothetical protein
MKMSIDSLYTRFISGYGPTTHYYKDASKEDKDLLDAVYAVLKSRIHPCSFFTLDAINRVNKICNVNFNDIECEDAKLPSTNVKEQITSLNPEDAPSTAVCKHYSCDNNLSLNYEYANTVNFATCDSNENNAMYCTFAYAQSICPLYKADYGLFATHTIDENSVYKSYKERTVSDYVISVYDSSNNLLTKLNYPTSVINDLASGALEEEITEIIKTIHKSTFNQDNCSFVSDFPSVSELSEDPSKSYISSLIS